MVGKKEDKPKYHGEEIGIAGFTLGILSIIFAGGAGIIIAIVGFFLCLYQQRKHPVRIGKTGLILNVIGFFVGIIYLVIAVSYILPKMQELIQQAQTFPAA